MLSLPKLLFHTFKSRPRLLSSSLLGIVVYFLIPDGWAPHALTKMLLAWNVGVMTYIGLVAQMSFMATPETIRKRALNQSESRFVTMLLVVVAAVVCMIAISAQLAVVKDMHGELKAAHISLAILTIVTSWVFTHTMFALHYAHDYYEALTHKRSLGLEFPDTKDPEYGDFFYCAFIIGTSGQTADVSFTNKSMRRVGLVHSVLAFLFNTTILAMTINIAAGFF